MRTLVVFAYPLPGSLTAHLARHVASRIDAVTGAAPEGRGLCAGRVDPVLRAKDRCVFDESTSLSTSPRMVLVFLTWWFGSPAILKGWTDCHLETWT